MSELTFKQAILVAAVPSLIGLSATYYSQKVGNDQAIIQARMTERDLINVEGQIKNKEDTSKTIHGYLIPVADNRAWGNYYDCREKKGARFDCAEEQRKVKPNLTPKIVKEGVDFGYEN
ncbi:MAG: hypothetical protein OQL19_17950 [Gammaproteobacteria bacterium]|nr:hypothetical protein [Gammaproteobacteria bacterium]